MGGNHSKSNQQTKDNHTKKHDHSILGKHTKEEKLEFLAMQKSKNENQNGDHEKNVLNQQTKDNHIKKHDHSILGKHTKAEKLEFLAMQKSKNENQNGNQEKNVDYVD